MDKNIAFFAERLAEEHKVDKAVVLGLIDHASKGNPLAHKGVMGKSRPSINKKQWYGDLVAGITELARLKGAFDGDELRAAAAFTKTEAMVRSAGENWRNHLPAGLG